MFEQSLISADQNWFILAALLSICSFGIWAERTKWGSKLSGTVIIILTSMLLSNLSVIPYKSGVYDFVWSYFVPLSIPLLLFKANLKKIIRETGTTLLAFFIGVIGTIAGTLFAYNIIDLGKEGWKIASIFCATYIGGSINYVSAAEAVGLKSGDLLAAGIAADMLVMALYFLVLFSLPSIVSVKKYFNSHKGEITDKYKSQESSSQETGNNTSETLTLESILKALATSAFLCAAGYGIAELSGLKGTGILFITAFTVMIATFSPKYTENIKGGDKLGTLLIQVFFAVIGANANIGIVIKTSPVLFLFAGIILTIHLLFLLIFGKLFKLGIIEIVVASNANMGGPTTAAAMAVAKKWDKLVVPAILVGTLGYAIATFISVALGYWLK